MTKGEAFQMMKKMKWFIYIFMPILFLFGLLNTKVEATSWIELEAEEVNDRAQVIVRGTYNFSKKAMFNYSNFQRVDFQVNRVYRGEAAEIISAGIDEYDLGWAEEFQDEGGEFLLFLEEGRQVNFLLPVGGPNGMVHIKDEEVMGVTEEKQAVYEEILQGASQAPHSETFITIVKRTSFMTIFFVGILLLLGGILMKRLLKKR